MREMSVEKICDAVMDEMEKIAEKPMTVSSLENLYKLADIYKDMCALKSEGGYSEDGGYSYRRRDRRGRYSRDDGEDGDNREGDGPGIRRGGTHVRERYRDDGYLRYSQAKRDYRSGKTAECKERLMDTVDEYMDSFTKQMEEMLHDSDCAEERDTIRRYLDKLKNI